MPRTPFKPSSLVTWIQSRRIGFRHLWPDVVVMCASLVLALLLRLPPERAMEHANALIQLLPVIFAVRILTMAAAGCYAVMWRYISTNDVVRLAAAIFISTGIVLSLTFLFPEYMSRLPRSVYLIDTVLAVLGLMSVRLFRRLLYEGRAIKQSKSGQRTLIYGAGQNGRHLAQLYKSDPGLASHVVGFIDDDPSKSDLNIGGVPVLGNRQTLAHVIDRFKISQLVVATPQVSGEFLKDLVMATRPFNIRPRMTSPNTVRTEGGKSGGPIQIVRDLNLADLLNHPPRAVDLKPVLESVRGKCILITGAGGSIGSELARQILSFEPKRLLLLDHSEFNLYEIDRELRLATHNVERVVPLLIDLKDENSLRNAIKLYAPDSVFHAAAYKHVHLVENNPFSAILNNIDGTRKLLRLCEEAGVKNFLMISTDKAVNPAGVMGATKRVCELLVTDAAKRQKANYCSVRFGNVLGSSGSLIPLLKQQIEAGGPVTITHQDMTRFFMLIPEAVSLVLRSATVSKPGDISILRMGEPIRILDVAKSLIALLGRTEDEIPIVFTGLRPGEKLFEELYITGDELATEDPDILTIPNGDTASLDSRELEMLSSRVDEMVEKARIGAPEALYILNDIVKSNYSVKSVSQDQGVVYAFPKGH